MYSPGFVEIYDDIYTRMKDYGKEADQVREWIRRAHPRAKTLLDVACGTAEHARYLKSSYEIDEPDLKVCRMSATETRGGHSYLEFSFLVGTPKGTSFFKEEHLLGLFTVEQTRQAFEACGLKVRFDEKGLFGRGLFIGEKS
jgi:hypothetical protein